MSKLSEELKEAKNRMRAETEAKIQAKIEDAAVEKAIETVMEAPEPKPVTLETLPEKAEGKPTPKPSYSWKAAKVLEIPEKYKDPRFVYRFCSKNMVGNIDKKLQEGWVIDKEILPKMIRDGLMMPRTIQDGSPMDSTLQIRELIVMKLPKEMAESRTKYYQDRADVMETGTSDQFVNEAVNAGIKTYGSGLTREHLNRR